MKQKNKNSEKNIENIAITQMGMVTSIGHDVCNACASMRTGLRRSVTLENFYVYSKEKHEEFEDGLISGYPVFEYDYDDSITRLLKIFDMTVDDFKKGLDESFTDLPLYLSIPEGFRKLNWMEEFREKLELKIKENKLFSDTPVFFEEGNIGVLKALSQGVKDIRSGAASRAVIMGLDTLVGFDDLSLFNKLKKLKTILNSDGFMPGEAGACFMIEKVSSENEDRDEVYIEDVLTSDENESEKNLKDLILSIVEKKDEYQVDAVITDINGEAQRAEELGLLFSESFNNFDGEKELFCVSRTLGETGAAYGAIGVINAVMGIKNNCTSSVVEQGRSLILASSNNGSKACASIIPKHYQNEIQEQT